MNAPTATGRQALFEGLARDFSPTELRNLASSLLRLADAVDQDWDGPPTGPMFRWPNALTRIEKRAYILAVKAREIYDRRRCRKDFVPPGLLGEPAWDMLLDLFMQYAGGAKVSTTSLCIASDCPPSTALRHIDQLEQAGLVERSPSAHDKRITFVGLTDKGVIAMGNYLEEC